MRAWLPVPGTTTGRLIAAALTQFGAHGFAGVNVADIAREAGVTTGALYHHFGSKLGLYEFVRADVERRLLDRMAGAAAASGSDRATTVRAALLVGFDFAVGERFLRILGEPPAGSDGDRLADVLGSATTSPVLGRVLAAAWRAALAAVAEGTDAQEARAAIEALEVRMSSPQG